MVEFFYNGKGSKSHSPEKQPFPWILFHYNLWGCVFPPFGSYRDHCPKKCIWHCLGSSPSSLTSLNGGGGQVLSWYSHGFVAVFVWDWKVRGWWVGRKRVASHGTMWCDKYGKKKLKENKKRQKI